MWSGELHKSDNRIWVKNEVYMDSNTVVDIYAKNGECSVTYWTGPEEPGAKKIRFTFLSKATADILLEEAFCVAED